MKTQLIKTAQTKSNKYIYSVVDQEGKTLYTSAPTHRLYYAIIGFMHGGEFVVHARAGRPDLMSKGDFGRAMGRPEAIVATTDFVMSNGRTVDFENGTVRPAEPQMAPAPKAAPAPKVEKPAPAPKAAAPAPKKSGDTDKVADKVRKLFALGKSPEAAEAASALAMAKKLMDEYGLTMDDLTRQAIKELKAKLYQKTPNPYTVALVKSVCSVFGCDWYRSNRFVEGLGNCSWVHIVGEGVAAEYAMYAFDVLHRRMVNDRDAYASTLGKVGKEKTAKADAYAYAWALAVRDNLKKTMKNVPVPAGVAKRFEELGIVTQDGKRVVRDQEAMAAGAAKGAGVSLDAPVSGSAKKAGKALGEAALGIEAPKRRTRKGIVK